MTVLILLFIQKTKSQTKKFLILNCENCEHIHNHSAWSSQRLHSNRLSLLNTVSLMAL